MVQLFIDGGGFMWPILFIFIIGFVFVIERLYHLFKGLSSNEDFAYEVWSIHYDKKKTKAIYGKATSAEIDELKEEGIQTITIPWIKETEN